MQQIVIENEIIYYEIEYKNIKNAYIRYKDGIFHITACINISNKKIEEFVKKYALKLKKRVQDNKTISLRYDYSIDKRILFMGKEYDLIVGKGNNEIEVSCGKIYAYLKKIDEKSINRSMNDWFLKKTYEMIDEIKNDVLLPFREMGLSPDLISVKKYKSRWGCCSYKTKEIIINSCMAHLDIKYLRYVLNHEACHLKYPNHQKGFHELLDRVYPLNKSIKKELNRYRL